MLLGLSLCLSAAMIIVTIIQVSGMRMRQRDTVDIVWEVYWQFVELCIAVTMASLTTFRSFFIQHRTRREEPPNRQRYARITGLRNKASTLTQPAYLCDMPQMPQPTFTGPQTSISVNERQAICCIYDDREDARPLQHSSQGQEIMIQHDLTTHSEPASPRLTDESSATCSS